MPSSLTDAFAFGTKPALQQRLDIIKLLQRIQRRLLNRDEGSKTAFRAHQMHRTQYYVVSKQSSCDGLQHTRRRKTREPLVEKRILMLPKTQFEAKKSANIVPIKHSSDLNYCNSWQSANVVSRETVPVAHCHRDGSFRTTAIHKRFRHVQCVFRFKNKVKCQWHYGN